jgi:hypothetical protein
MNPRNSERDFRSLGDHRFGRNENGSPQLETTAGRPQKEQQNGRPQLGPHLGGPGQEPTAGSPQARATGFRAGDAFSSWETTGLVLPILELGKPIAKREDIEDPST